MRLTTMQVSYSVDHRHRAEVLVGRAQVAARLGPILPALILYTEGTPRRAQTISSVAGSGDAIVAGNPFSRSTSMDDSD